MAKFFQRGRYTLSDQKGGDELALTPTLVFNKAKTRIVKLNLNCIIIQLCPSLLSFLPCIYSVRFPSSIPSLHLIIPPPLSPLSTFSPPLVTLVHRQSSLPFPGVSACIRQNVRGSGIINWREIRVHIAHPPRRPLKTGLIRPKVNALHPAVSSPAALYCN